VPAVGGSVGATRGELHVELLVELVKELLDELIMESLIRGSLCVRSSSAEPIGEKELYAELFGGMILWWTAIESILVLVKGSR